MKSGAWLIYETGEWAMVNPEKGNIFETVHIVAL